MQHAGTRVQGSACSSSSSRNTIPSGHARNCTHVPASWWPAASLVTAAATSAVQVLRVSGTVKQQLAAARLIPLVAKPHWLLCTLLLCNAACMEALPLFLDRLLNPVVAILLSVTAILLFGEIIPQAVCSR